jgi:hypothetical protein
MCHLLIWAAGCSPEADHIAAASGVTALAWGELFENISSERWRQ